MPKERIDMMRTNPLKTVFRNTARVLILFCMITLLCPVSVYAREGKKSIEQRLSELDGVISVEKIWLVPFVSKFDERYIVTFSQPLDWEHPEKGSFPQRVEVSLKKGSDITAMDTEGYLLMDEYMMLGVPLDIVEEYGASVVHPEHRFFGKSRPADMSNDDTRYWEYMTSENAANDLHKVYTEMSKILGDVWFSCGTSYSGLMSNIYAHYFPEDMRVYCPTAAPFALSTSDGRMYEFVYTKIGDAFGKERGAELRKLVTDFQVDLLKNKKELLPLYTEKVEASGLRFRDSIDKLYDMNVLEFAVQIWQSNQQMFDSVKKVLALPETTEKEKEKKLEKELSTLLTVQPFEDWSPDFMAWPYYVHTAKEIGRQSYDFSYLRKALADAGLPDTLSVTEESEKTLFADLVFTEEQKKAFVYDPSFRDALDASIDTSPAKHLMIYGATDPWTSLRIHDTDNKNVKILFHPTGTHVTIMYKQFPDKMQAEIKSFMDSCLK